MTILDSLIEKKDILIYLKFRRKRLREELKDIEKYPEKKREGIVRVLEVRIKELDRLLQLILENKLKEDCKMMWNYFNKK